MFNFKMWFLSSEVDQRVIYVTESNKEVLVGRTSEGPGNCFVIPDDPSISRKHATLSLLNNELYILDLGSRYGTFVNTDNKIESNSKIKLNDKDVVKFGKMGSVWRVNNKSFITCTSTLKGENLQNLLQCVKKLSGSLKSEWDESCQFLTMPAITITMKVVLALVQGAHIVTVDYWHKCIDAVNSQMPLPDPNKFTPQVIESTLNKEVVSFTPNVLRQTLFSGLKVVFFSKQKYELYKIVLTKASATPLLLSESKMTKSMLCEKDVIVIQCSIPAPSQDTQAQRDSILDIVNYMKSKGKRLISDVEIGLAVLYCSTEKYCNPAFNFPSEVIKQTGQNTKSATVLAPETQEQTQRTGSKENIIINETLPSSLSSKRKCSDDMDIQENSSKKFAMDGSNKNGTSGGIKRKVNETNDIQDNPSKKHAAGDFDDEDGFDFVNNISSNTTHGDSSTKRLNLAKPQKRKLEDGDDDDLFQFIQDEQVDSESATKPTLFGAKNIKREPNLDKDIENDVDISTLRGAKLEELMKNNEKLMKSDSFDMKNPIKEELDEKMGNLSLGTTIVRIRTDLVVKKEPIQIEEKSNGLKNFKKFKKVWPVKMQVTIIPSSSMSIYKEESSTKENISAQTETEGSENSVQIPDSEDKNDVMIQDSQVY